MTKKRCTWIESEILALVDQWARDNTPIGQKVNISKSVENLIRTHQNTQKYLK